VNRYHVGIKARKCYRSAGGVKYNTVLHGQTSLAVAPNLDIVQALPLGATVKRQLGSVVCSAVPGTRIFLVPGSFNRDDE